MPIIEAHLSADSRVFEQSVQLIIDLEEKKYPSQRANCQAAKSRRELNALYRLHLSRGNG
jgi:hypothetical protein